MYTADKAIIENLTFPTVAKFILRHQKEHTRLNKLHDYYCGKHEILTRPKEKGLPNNKIVCNHAKEISDTATGYFIGNPIAYTGEKMDKLLEWFKTNGIEAVDLAIAKCMSLYGKGVEYVSMSDDAVPIPESYSIHPKNAFVVYDNTVKHRPLFGVYYFPLFDIDGNHTGFSVEIITKESITLYKTDTNFTPDGEGEERENPFKDITVIEYSNNDEQQGDFEQVIGLIDAYNLLLSDRVNDKEQFVDSILLLINAVLGDTPEETAEAKEKLQRNKLLELPGESDARYLTRTFDENGVATLQKELGEDIHRFANIPCLSDENFAGNASGVAMEYKMLGIEMITKIKERMFGEGIKKRVALYNTINQVKGGVPFGEVTPVYTRGLPKNLQELANIVSQLDGVVPAEILLPLLPFIKDVPAAIELLKQQKAENIKAQQEAFGGVENTPPDDVNEE